MIRPVIVPTDDQLREKNGFWMIKFTVLYIDIVYLMALAALIISIGALVLAIVR